MRYAQLLLVKRLMPASRSRLTGAVAGIRLRSAVTAVSACTSVRMPTVKRARPFLITMHRLALLAALLMIAAPLISRWLQTTPDTTQPMCITQQDHSIVAADGHAGHAAMMAAHAGHVPAPEHALHEYACDYCMLAARLLPWLAVALLLWTLPRGPRVSTLAAYPAVAAVLWPAHAARGPPIYL